MMHVTPTTLDARVFTEYAEQTLRGAVARQEGRVPDDPRDVLTDVEIPRWRAALALVKAASWLIAADWHTGDIPTPEGMAQHALDTCDEPLLHTIIRGEL